jgi:hypothetical protein
MSVYPEAHPRRKYELASLNPVRCHSRYRVDENLAAMAILRTVLLVVVTCAFFAAVTGSDSFNMRTPLREEEISCLEECQFLADNQTIIIINITNPKIAVKGVAYYTTPIRMKDPATRKMASFNTSFTFREEPKNYNSSPMVTLQQMEQWDWGDGFTFMMTNSSSWVGDPGGRFGIFAGIDSNNPKVVAVEFDSFANADTDPLMFVNTSQPPNVDNHVGLDIGSANSTCFTPRSYLLSLNISLWQRMVLHTWIEYDGNTSTLELRLAKNSTRPDTPTFTCIHDLYDAVDEKMWIGFSGSIGDQWSVYYMYNWTFTSFGISPDFSCGDGKVVPHVAGICGGVFLALLCIAVVSAEETRQATRVWGQGGVGGHVGDVRASQRRHQAVQRPVQEFALANASIW